MTETRLRSLLGLFLIVSQFAVILMTASLHFLGGLRFDEMTTAVALIVPMFAVHTTTVVKYFIAHRADAEEDGSSRVTVAFTFLALFFPLLFVSSLFAVILLKAYGVALGSFDQFKGALGIIQTCFAVYIGLFISSLYEDAHRRHSSDHLEQADKRRRASRDRASQRHTEN